MIPQRQNKIIADYRYPSRIPGKLVSKVTPTTYNLKKEGVSLAVINLTTLQIIKGGYKMVAAVG